MFALCALLVCRSVAFEVGRVIDVFGAHSGTLRRGGGSCTVRGKSIALTTSSNLWPATEPRATTLVVYVSVICMMCIHAWSLNSNSMCHSLQTRLAGCCEGLLECKYIIMD